MAKSEQKEAKLHGLNSQQIADLIEQNKHIYDDYFDPNYTISLERNIFDYVNKHYFRSRFIGFENYPQRNNPDRPLIFASNHSGMAFPWDAMVFGAGVFKMNKHDLYHTCRGLTAPMLSMSRLMHPFLIHHFWKRVGGIDATTLNFETLMHYNFANILIYPEGVPGIGKGFDKRYQLQRFSTSFVRMSLKYQTDVIPVYTVNGEYINPYSYRLPWIDKLVQKIGIPFLPLSPMTLLILLQPWLFYFAFPARLTYVLGEPIKPYTMNDKDYDSLTQEEINQIRDQIQTTMQNGLDKAVAEYGQEPFELKNLLLNNLSNITKIPFFSSPGWVLLFSEHERLYAQNNGLPIKDMHLNWWSFFTILFRNPFLISFFIPIFGWIPILLAGYRGHQIQQKTWGFEK